MSAEDKAEKEVNWEIAMNFVCWEGVWHSVPPHAQLGQGQQENSEQEKLK